jgi:hypothetical protein
MTSIAVAVIAAIASVLAAVVAGLFAMASRRYEARLQQSGQARDRISEIQFRLYADFLLAVRRDIGGPGQRR